MITDHCGMHSRSTLSNWKVLAKAGIFKSIMAVFSEINFACKLFSVCWHIQLLSTMSRKWNVFDCRENYDGTLYSPTVSVILLKYPEDWKRWIDAMLKIDKSLAKLREIQICYHHVHLLLDKRSRWGQATNTITSNFFWGNKVVLYTVINNAKIE